MVEAAAGLGGGSGNPLGPEAPKQTTTPKPKLESHPPKQTRSTTARFVFGGPAGSQLPLQARPRQAGRLPLAADLPTAEAGRHTVRIYATNGSAGQSAATVFSWKVVRGAA